MSRVVTRSIRIAACQPCDVTALQCFIDAHWRSGHILANDRDLLLWQFDGRRMDPTWDGPSVLLAWQETKLVGMQCLIPATINVHGTTVKGVYLSNLLVLPQARQHGVALRLLAAVSQLDVNAWFDVGINPDVLPLFQALGYNIIQDMPRWTAVFDEEAVRRILTDAGMRDLPRYSTARPTVGSDCARELTGPLSEGWNAVWSSRFAPTQVGTARTADYINWRYVHHPRFSYQVRVVEDVADQGMAGLAVFRIETLASRHRVMRIVEFLAAPSSAPCLASAIVNAGHEAGVAYADFYCTAASIAAPLESAGFLREGPGEVLPSRLQPVESARFQMTAAWRLDPAPDRSIEDHALYITRSDGDMDRPN